MAPCVTKQRLILERKSEQKEINGKRLLYSIFFFTFWRVEYIASSHEFNILLTQLESCSVTLRRAPTHLCNLARTQIFINLNSIETALQCFPFIGRCRKNKTTQKQVIKIQKLWDDNWKKLFVSKTLSENIEKREKGKNRESACFLSLLQSLFEHCILLCKASERFCGRTQRR